jgi:septal ring factor EnvC (AmiA/AmiB activator)
VSAHDLREEVAILDRQADATARLVAALDRQLAAIGAEERDASGRLARAGAELDRQQVGLRRRLVAIWKRGPLYEAEALLSAATFADLVARYKYLHELARRDRLLVRRVERLRNEVAGQRALLVRLQGELARNRDDRAAEEARLRTFGERRGAALATVVRQQQGAERRLAQVARDEARLEGLIASLEAARRRAEARAAEQRAAAGRAADARAVAAAAARVAAERAGRRGAPARDAEPAVAAASGPPGAAAAVPSTGDRLAAGAVGWPARGALLYRFGRVVGANNTTTRWNGVGIAVPAGTAVRAAAAGRVALAQAIGTYGLTVIVQHGGGDYSVYGSLQRADVARATWWRGGRRSARLGGADPDLPRTSTSSSGRPGARSNRSRTLRMKEPAGPPARAPRPRLPAGLWPAPSAASSRPMTSNDASPTLAPARLPDRPLHLVTAGPGSSGRTWFAACSPDGSRVRVVDNLANRAPARTSRTWPSRSSWSRATCRTLPWPSARWTAPTWPTTSRRSGACRARSRTPGARTTPT